MADELVKKRITEYGTEVTPDDLDNSDVIFVDSTQHGTRKLRLKGIRDIISGIQNEGIKSSGVSVTADNYATTITNVNNQPVNTIYAYAEGLQSNIANLPSNNALNIMHYTYKYSVATNVGQVQIAIERSGEKPTMYFRTTGGTPVSWSSWVKMANNADIEAIREELKSALSYIDSGSGNINFGELVPNEYVDSANGSFVSYNNWSRTKFIDISLFATIAVKYGYQSEYNAFYDANRTFISNFTVRTSLTPLTVPSNAKYIVLSSTILGMNSLIGEFTTKQDDTINSLSTNVSALTEKTANISNELISQINIHYGTGGWVQGSWGAIADWANPNANESAKRIKQELSVQSGNPITISIGTGYKFNYAAFTSEGTLLEYKLNFPTDSIYLNYSDISTVRVIVAKADDGNITPSEYVESGISVYDFGSYIPVKLKVMSYNIGRYSHGTSPYYLDSDFDTKVANLKKFFAEQKCDFVGLQEANDYLDSETIGTKSANDYVYDYLYPYHRDLNGLTSLKSKYKLIGSGTGTFSTGREYVYGVLQLGNKNIYVMSVHLTPNAGQEAARANERAEIRTLMSNHKYAICCGDFNAQDSAEFDDFISNGFHIANGGYLPAVNTYGGLTVFQERNPMDNIVTTSNIIIDYSERLNVFNELVSDHVPFIAHLTVN